MTTLEVARMLQKASSSEPWLYGFSQWKGIPRGDIVWQFGRAASARSPWRKRNPPEQKYGEKKMEAGSSELTFLKRAQGCSAAQVRVTVRWERTSIPELDVTPTRYLEEQKASVPAAITWGVWARVIETMRRKWTPASRCAAFLFLFLFFCFFAKKNAG